MDLVLHLRYETPGTIRSGRERGDVPHTDSGAGRGQ